MWLGMLVAALGQIAGVPVEPLVWLAGAARAGSSPRSRTGSRAEWAQVEAPLRGAAIALAAVGLAGCGAGARAPRARIRGGGARLRPRWRSPTRSRSRGGWRLALAPVLAIAGGPGLARPRGLRIRFLDVGQGDAILLEPAGRPAVLIDAGPPGRGRRALDRFGDRAPRRGRAHPRPGRPRRRRRGGPRPDRGRTASLFGAPRPADAERRPGGGRAVGPGRGRATGCAPGDCASTSSGRSAARLAAPRSGGPRSGDPNQPRSSSWRAGELRGASHRRRRGRVRRRSTRARSTCSRSPTTAARTPASAALLAGPIPALAVISVGSGNPYGHPAPETLATLASRARARPPHRRGGRGRGRGLRRAWSVR